jgi:hypothetical protein
MDPRSAQGRQTRKAGIVADQPGRRAAHLRRFDPADSLIGNNMVELHEIIIN